MFFVLVLVLVCLSCVFMQKVVLVIHSIVKWNVFVFVFVFIQNYIALLCMCVNRFWTELNGNLLLHINWLVLLKFLTRVYISLSHSAPFYYYLCVYLCDCVCGSKAEQLNSTVLSIIYSSESRLRLVSSVNNIVCEWSLTYLFFFILFASFS